MKSKIILSFVLLMVCFVAFSQENNSRRTKSPEPTAVEQGLIKVSIMYPFSEGKTFDMEYYEKKHMPMVAGFLGSNLVKYTIEKGLANGMQNQPLPYMAVGILYVKSLSDYQAAVGPKRNAIRDDIPNYTNALPLIFISEVIR